MQRTLFFAFLSVSWVSALVVACGGGSSTPPASSTDDASSSADGNADGASSADAMGSDSGDAQGAWDGALGFACSGASPTFSADVHPIFTASCGGEMCHGGLAQGTWPYAQLVGVKVSRDLCNPSAVIVTPSSLAKSYLMNKLTGLGMCPGTNQMPKTGMPLSTHQIQTIADWICVGAPND